MGMPTPSGQRSDYQFYTMQARHSVAVADRCRDDTNRASFADSSRANLHINGKSAPPANSVRANSLKQNARFLNIKGDYLLAFYLRAACNSENIIHAPRPDEPVVGKITLPKACMLNRQGANMRRRDDVGDSPI